MPLSDPVVNSLPLLYLIQWHGNMLKSDGRIRLKRKSPFFYFLSFISLAGSRSSGSNRSGSKNDANVAAGTQESGGRSGSGSESEKRERLPASALRRPLANTACVAHTIRSVQSLVCVAPGLPPQTVVTAGPRPGLGGPNSQPHANLSAWPWANPSEFFVDVMVMSTHMLKALWNQEKKMWRERCICMI